MPPWLDLTAVLPVPAARRKHRGHPRRRHRRRQRVSLTVRPPVRQLRAGFDPSGRGPRRLRPGRRRRCPACPGSSGAHARSRSSSSAQPFDERRSAERYGLVNRALPDPDLDAFVETLASDIANVGQYALHARQGARRQRDAPPDGESPRPTRHSSPRSRCTPADALPLPIRGRRGRVPGAGIWASASSRVG